MATREDIQKLRRDITKYLSDNGPTRLNTIAEVFDLKSEKVRLHLNYLVDNNYVSKTRIEGTTCNASLYKVHSLYKEGTEQPWANHYEVFRNMILKAIKERKKDDEQV